MIPEESKRKYRHLATRLQGVLMQPEHDLEKKSTLIDCCRELYGISIELMDHNGVLFLDPIITAGFGIADYSRKEDPIWIIPIMAQKYMDSFVLRFTEKALEKVSPDQLGNCMEHAAERIRTMESAPQDDLDLLQDPVELMKMAYVLFIHNSKLSKEFSPTASRAAAKLVNRIKAAKPRNLSPCFVAQAAMLATTFLTEPGFNPQTFGPLVEKAELKEGGLWTHTMYNAAQDKEAAAERICELAEQGSLGANLGLASLIMQENYMFRMFPEASQKTAGAALSTLVVNVFSNSDSTTIAASTAVLALLRAYGLEEPQGKADANTITVMIKHLNGTEKPIIRLGCVLDREQKKLLKLRKHLRDNPIPMPKAAAKQKQ